MNIQAHRKRKRLRRQKYAASILWHELPFPNTVYFELFICTVP